MQEQPRTFDICIMCALHEEAKAVIDEFSKRSHVSFTQAYYGNLFRYEYHYTTLQNKNNESLTVMVTWLPRTGPTSMAQDARSLFEQFRPRFMAMTGICAGDRREVELGDLVVASSAYHYEEGKVMPKGHKPATNTSGPDDQILQYARGFDGWKKPAAQLREQFLKKGLQVVDRPKRLVAPMASGMAVRADDPFTWLQKQYHRDTVALDMEAASFYAGLQNLTHALVVKGVCDFADIEKKDTHHDYAARGSAVYMYYFIQEYVTNETIPPDRNLGDDKLPYPGALVPLNQFIQDFRALRGEIANHFSLKGSKGFNFKSCENRYSQLYKNTIAFLATSFPRSVIDDAEGFAVLVQRKVLVELDQRNDVYVSITRWILSPLANFEKLAAQIDACVSTLEEYKKKYFPVPGS